MNTENIWANPEITAATIEGALRQARAARAEAMRAAVGEVPALFKRLAVALRPNRQRLPQAGAWA